MPSERETGKKRKRSSSSKKQRKMYLQGTENQENECTLTLFGEGENRRSYPDLPLKEDHHSRPIWVCPDKHIFLETFSPLYQKAYDFLIAVAEPVSRPKIIQEYKFTDYSLYAAVSVGLTTEVILTSLNRLCKTVELPKEIEFYITKTTERYGKVSLVLRQNRYFLESSQTQVLVELLKSEKIQFARKQSEDCDPETGFIKSQFKKITVGLGVQDTASTNQNDFSEFEVMDDDDIAPQNMFSFEVNMDKISEVREECLRLNYPTLEEYDFANDTINMNIALDLKPSTVLRPYQEKSLSKMFGNGRARSGVIVLPCGAGKTLVGITATCTVKKRAIVLTTSSVAVLQWKAQFRLWSTIDKDRIACVTSQGSQTKDFLRASNDFDIIITTYNMLTFQGNRSEHAQKMLDIIRRHEWGLLVLDEVHVVPADTFRNVFKVCAAHCKLGLSATLVREDDKIGDINFLIGSKLYEANWLDLSREGHIAKVSCAEVWCDMTPEFYQKYLKTTGPGKRLQLYIMNPNKFRTCEFLIKYHEARNDKVIVFSDDVFALKHYAEKLKKYYIYGKTSENERNEVLNKFKVEENVKTIFISKIGDCAIDLPDANVLIQISFHFGARRQEAQRLGRILRAKAQTDSEYNAFFYTLISKDTEEMAYCTKRQQFLINQGYAFRVISHIPEMETAKLHYSTKEEQLQLLAKVLTAREEEDKTPEDLDEINFRRAAGNSRNLSGAGGRAYGTRSIWDAKPVKNPLMRARKKPKRS